MNIEANLNTSSEDLRETLFSLLFDVTDESLSRMGMSPDTDFTETGMSSIEYLKFVDRIESTFGVAIDLEADGNLNTVEKFLKVLQKQGL